MKKVVFLFSIMLISAITSNAQSNEQILEDAINYKFIAWGSEWWVDDYVPNSVVVGNIDYSNPSLWVVTGQWKFERAFSHYNATFTAKVAIYSDNSYKIKSLCYYDPTTGDSECKSY
ncbi:MAG: hypothetical protein JXR68_02840 [Bacteroidales bacterium]|nr:hypothetical protein [Bacteroidales bacterium]